MNRVFCFVALTAMAGVCWPSAVGQSIPQSKPTTQDTSDPMRAWMEARGFVAVPLIEEQNTNRFLVECRSGMVVWRMLVDTGAEYCLLDLAVAKKLGLQLGEEVTTLGVGGTQTGSTVTLRGFSIAPFDTRTVGNRIEMVVHDLASIRKAGGADQSSRFEGVLGHSVLKLCSAVIDYRGHTLYLRPPLAGLWPAIEGKWAATAVEEDGRRRPSDAPLPRLEFKDNQMHLIDGPNSYQYGIHVGSNLNPCIVALFDPKKQLAAELVYPAGGLLKVTGDKLTLCLFLDNTKSKAFPKDFTTAPDTGHTLIEFRRVK